ncbi:S-layer homology domain-containing protein [Paenibacillus senegalensis]|uniref:S-layer homology domain-containing protein n=1 Tax=Paenibacillus senegalensis TaxID=1465766 RepID=UPI0002886CE3|nr:S-layer homology domain-containing protein [Paenibacillus senegalensis]
MKQERIRHAKGSGLLALSFLFLLLWLPSYVSAAQVDSLLPTRSEQEVNDKWNQWMKPGSTELPIFVDTPSTSLPYAAGSLHGDYVQQGLNAANFYRFISGLDGNLVLDPSLNKQAQHGAVLIAISGQLTHEPKQPAGMPNDFYELGYQSAGTSNLYYAYGQTGNFLVNSIVAYMNDSDKFNIDRVGHRRWILSPQLQKVGFGLATIHNSAKNQTEYYSVMQIFDKSKPHPADYNYSLFPNKGSFPIEAFGADQAWSIQLNPQHFQKPQLSDVQVQVTRLADQKTWQLNHTTQQNGQAYFNVDTNQFGYGYAVIFRPDGIEQLADGDQFQVTVTGLKKSDGTSAEISYQTNFFNVGKPQPSHVKPAASSHFTDTASHWAREAIQWAVSEQVVSGYEDGTFKPDAQVTEAEFLAMLFKLYSESKVLQTIQNSTGSTASNSGVWSDPFYNYATALNLDVEDRLKDTSLRNHAIKRVEVAQFVAGLGGKHYTNDDDAIRYLLQMGYSSGKTSATVEGYAGQEKLTRAEAIVFLKNLKERGFELQSRPTTPTVFTAQAN